MSANYQNLLEIIQEIQKLLLEGQKLSDKEEIKELFLKGQKLSKKAKTFITRQKNIIQRNEKNHQKLIRYAIMLEDYTMWRSRKNYFKITNSFLKNEVNGTDFCHQILILRSENLNQAREGEANLKYETDFNLTKESIGFSLVVENLYFFLDLFDPNIEDSESNEYCLSENGLRSAVKEIILPEFSKYSDKN